LFAQSGNDELLGSGSDGGGSGLTVDESEF
jgi:hypothetical protein